MKLIESIPYLEFSEMLQCGLKEDTVKKALLRGSFKSISDPDDKRRVLIEYDSLKEQYKEKVQKVFGNPYEYVAKQPIRALLQKDFKAETFFYSYNLTDDKKLPVETAARYTQEAAWLNMIIHARDNFKKVIKEGLNLSIDQFFTHVRELLEVDKQAGKISSNFPCSYSKLIAKVNEYKDAGYACLIDKRFGNQSASKITDELSEAMLKEMLAHANQYDCALIAEQYNQWAGANNYKAITRATVHNKLQEWMHEIQQNRYGRETYNRESRRKVTRMRPSRPLALVESDDSHLDWWFNDDKGSYKRIKGIIVTDSYNDYVLGYAITDGDLAGTELVRLAYLNAMHHVNELTGGFYFPYEVKTDQWNISNLRPFYQSIAHYQDTPVGSKNRGWLENFFGHIDWERSLKIGYNNYNGHNITAKTTGVNREAVIANRKNWPHLAEAEKQMQEFVHRLRTQPENYDPKNKSRQQEWLEAWAALPEEKKLPMSDEQRLLKFGFNHSAENSITSYGIRPTIHGIGYAYAVPPALYIQNVGKKVQVVYDPLDMNKVLITDNAKLRFVAKSMTPVAGCMADMQEFGGRELLNQILNEAKADSANIMAKAVRRQAVLADAGIDVNDIIKRGITVPKATKQLAEASYNVPVALPQMQEIEDDADIDEFDPLSIILNR